ncbi:MAG: anthranilate synthase component II [Bacteroidota bacterium]
MYRFLLLDNRDSFTYNLQAWVLHGGHECRVVDHHQGRDAWEEWSWDAAILGPGPGTPPKAGNLMGFIDRYADARPMLGICLGHQALGMYYGANLVHAKVPVHGKRSRLRCEKELLALLPTIDSSEQVQERQVMRYHSLVLDRVPQDFELLACAEDDRSLQAMRHKTRPLWGYQFHPESVTTDISQEWLRIFVQEALQNRPQSSPFLFE